MLARDVTFALIAGGRGDRLGGVPKGLLRVEGRAVIERLLDHRESFASTLLVANEDAYARWGLETVRDVIPDRGAPGGVHAALSAAKTQWVFAVGIDMPFIQPAVIARVTSERGEGIDSAVFEVAGRLEPLLGLYRSALAARWASALPSSPSFRGLLEPARTRVLPESELRRLDPEARSVVSLNTPADLARWGATLP